MKKQLYKLLLVVMAFMMTAGTYAVEVDGICYNLNTEDKTAGVTRGTTYYSGEIVIPSQIEVDGEDYSVTIIEDDAFWGCHNLTAVTLPNSVTRIGHRAFKECYSLTSINIPNSVTSIGCDAFLGCQRITSITIPNSVTSIEAGTFSYCGLTSVTIPNSVTSIGNDAFSNCSDLVFITIPNSVTSIGVGAFALSGLITITIPNSVKSIGQSAFYNCSNLKSITLPSSITSIEKMAFQNCSRLKSFTIPGSVTSIGESAFSGCSGLTSITIPNSVTSIGYRAFEDCKGLTSVSISNSVTSLEYGTFERCTGLTSVTIPNSVTSIGDNVFCGCTGLTSITIPNSVTSIGGSAFAACSGLTSISIPNSVTSIGGYAFAECTGLTSITIPNSVILLDGYLFDRCTDLGSIYMESPTPPFFRYYEELGELNSSCIIYVPVGAREAYAAEEPWNKYSIQEYVDIVEKKYLTDGEVFEHDASSSVSQLTYAREFTNTEWQALYVPFSMSYADLQADFDIARINDVHQFDDNEDGTVDRTELEVILLKDGSWIEANRPYLIRAKEAGTKVITLTDAILEASVENSIDCSSVDTKYTFTGTYRGIPGAEMLSGGYYALADGELKQAASDAAALGTFRWYMKAESRDGFAAKLPARMSLRVVDPSAGGATGIEEATTAANSSAVEAYTLDGRKAGRFGSMDEARKQLPKGFYIVNGKKVLF